LFPRPHFWNGGRVDPATGKRRQCWIRCADQPVFAFAGVWKDSEVPSFALLTCEANAALRAEGRETMPVILPPDSRAHDTWLCDDWAKAQKLVQPYSSSLMLASSDCEA
jgi:putative SOS response-associated peptidase YedK